MDASIIYERFLHAEIDRINFMRIECAFCPVWDEHHKMIFYDGKRFCCEECVDEYIAERELDEN